MRTYNTLWRTYLFIVGVSLVSASAMIFLEWQHVKQSARTELEYANNIVTRSVQLLLHKDEALLKILGERLIELGPFQQSKDALDLLSNLLEKNPELAGLGLADLSGQLILTSLNIDRQNLPNLLETPETSESFKKAVNTDALVMGRTYYMKALKEWVIPVRYRITDRKGEAVAVMTTGLKLGSRQGLWSQKHLPEHVQLSIYRADLYRQFMGNVEQPDFADWYSQPVPDQLVNRFQKRMEEQAGMDLAEFRAGGKVVTVFFVDGKGERYITAASYDPVYSHYTLTSMPIIMLFNRLLVPASWLLALLVVFNATLYFIFRFNVRLQQEAKRNLEFQAKHDQLTKLPNRRYLLDEFSRWQKRHNGKFAVLFIDIDNFKASNDLHGHSVGDRILCKVADRINSAFTQSLNIRQGGDEFIILTKEIQDDDLLALCRQFMARLKQLIVVDGLEFSIRASIGIACAPVDGNKVDELLRKADMAMYEAKRLQCDIYVYSKNLEQRTERAACIEKELNHALQRNEFFLVYQPQVDASNRTVVGVEALLRWKNPSLGMVPPDEFIEVAESTGLIHDIGRYVFDTALNEFLDVYRILQEKTGSRAQLAEKPRLSVNVSVRQLLSDGFLDSLRLIVGRHDCAAINLMIEVTESLFIEDLDMARAILEEIEKFGIGISLDDFGTGYSSLSVLSKLPIDELKIDKEFVRDILTDDQDWLLIQSLISLSQSLGIPVLAEGVESGEQASMLAQHGCDLFQGYYFAKPMDKAALVDFLSASPGLQGLPFGAVQKRPIAG